LQANQIRGLLAEYGIVIPVGINNIANERLKSSSQAQDFLAAMAPTVVDLVASAALLLWHSVVPSWRALLLMAVAQVLPVCFKWHPAFVLAVGAALAERGAIP